MFKKPPNPLVPLYRGHHGDGVWSQVEDNWQCTNLDFADDDIHVCEDGYEELRADDQSSLGIELAKSDRLVWDGIWAWKDGELMKIINAFSDDGEPVDLADEWVIELRLFETAGALNRLLGEVAKQSPRPWSYELKYAPNNGRYVWQVRLRCEGDVVGAYSSRVLGRALAKTLLVAWEVVK